MNDEIIAMTPAFNLIRFYSFRNPLDVIILINEFGV